MFDFAWSEMLLCAAVALIVIGPKELPQTMRTVGRWVGKARGVARHFRSGFDAMVREAELEEMEKRWREENERIMREHPLNPQQGSGAVALPGAADAGQGSGASGQASVLVTDDPEAEADRGQQAYPFAGGVPADDPPADADRGGRGGFIAGAVAADGLEPVGSGSQQEDMATGGRSTEAADASGHWRQDAPAAAGRDADGKRRMAGGTDGSGVAGKGA